jgi:hypothetical protein
MHPLPIVVLVSGVAGAGKTTYSHELHRELAARNIAAGVFSFAERLKSAVTNAEAYFGFDVDRQTNWGDYSEKDKARPLLVELGRHLRRKNENVFARSLWRDLASESKDVVVIQDWRYLNEYNYMAGRARFVVPVKLTRDGFKPANDEESASLEAIHEVFDDLNTNVIVPEWKNRDELRASARSLAEFLKVTLDAVKQEGKV